jgi:branched-chain amino acid transport system ATP-binding protein
VSELEVDDVSRSFGSLLAVNRVSLAVEPGELHAIIGPNGAGKTTFFNLITGLLRSTSGAIRFRGREVTRLSATERVGLGMARTFQITEVFPELTVTANLRIAAEVAAGYRLAPWLSRKGARAIAERVEELTCLVGLAHRRDRLVGELSHGDQRAVEFGLALALRPRLLLLDEPTAGMGDEETAGIEALVRRLHRDEALTIVLIEHDMSLVFNLADRITVLDRGSVLATGTPDEIGANQAVQAAYLGAAA